MNKLYSMSITESKQGIQAFMTCALHPVQESQCKNTNCSHEEHDCSSSEGTHLQSSVLCFHPCVCFLLPSFCAVHPSQLVFTLLVNWARAAMGPVWYVFGCCVDQPVVGQMEQVEHTVQSLT